MEVKHIYDKILVATDGSKNAEVAIDHAVHIAEACRATLHAIYVADIDAYEPGSRSSGTSIHELLRKKGVEAIKKVELEGELHKVRVKSAILEGNPAEQIIGYAKEKEIDLIVIGKLGKTGISRFMIGSVAERVARASPTPVLIIKK